MPLGMASSHQFITEPQFVQLRRLVHKNWTVETVCVRMVAASASKALIHDEEFFFQDVIIQVRIGNIYPRLLIFVCLQVENRLFKVPRRVFVQESQVFRDMFSLPVPEGVKAEGASEDNPLKLDGIIAIDFVRLLRFLYPSK